MTSNVLTSYAKGNIALSISLTAINSILCVITVPLILIISLSILGYGSLNEGQSLLSIAIQMFLIVTVPVILGVLLSSILSSFEKVAKNISIEFGGQVPFFINGKITNLEEDMIEITKYEDNRVLYIDFEYKGIPKNLPIVSIKDFIPPEVDKDEDEEKMQGMVKIDDDEESSIDIESMGQLIDENDRELYDDDDLKLMVNEDLVKVMKQNKELILEADDVFDEDIGTIEVQEEYEVKEGQKRYDLESQTNDILNDMLSTIPTDKQSPKVLEKINTLIKRYVELRDEFSVKNSENNIIKSKTHGRHNKPLKQTLKDMSKQLKWIIPVVSNTKKIYNIDVFEDDAPEDIIVSELDYDLFDEYRNNQISSEENKTHYIINLSLIHI